jgi:hypothetical protein
MGGAATLELQLGDDVAYREQSMSEQARTHASEGEARDVAEAARESEWSGPSFVREMFLGRFRLDLIHPHPPDDPEEEERPAISSIRCASSSSASIRT